MGRVDEMRGGVNLTLRVERARTGTYQGVRSRCGGYGRTSFIVVRVTQPAQDVRP